MNLNDIGKQNKEYLDNLAQELNRDDEVTTVWKWLWDNNKFANFYFDCVRFIDEGKSYLMDYAHHVGYNPGCKFCKAENFKALGYRFCPMCGKRFKALIEVGVYELRPNRKISWDEFYHGKPDRVDSFEIEL